MLDDFTFSDHRYLTFEVKFRHPESLIVLSDNSAKWACRKLDPETLIRKISEGPPTYPSRSSAEGVAVALHVHLIFLCDSCIPRMTVGAHKCKPVHWWTETIAELRRQCIKSHRIYLRTLKRSGLLLAGTKIHDYR